MLNVFAIESSLPLVERLARSKYAVTPVLGSPLQKLVTATVIKEGMFNFDVGGTKINPRLMSELTNSNDVVTGYSEHDVVMRESVDFIAEKLAGQTAYARNDGAGVIEDLADNTQASIDSIPKFAEIGAEIIERNIPPVLLNESLMEAIQESANCPRVDIRLDLRLPELSAQEIRGLMKTGLPALDNVVSEYMAELDDFNIESLWSELFMGLNPISGEGKVGTNLSHFIAGEANIRNAVFVFLIARRLADKIIPNVNMTEGEYLRLTSDYRNQAAARLCDTMNVFANEEKNGRLIQSINGLKVTVNSQLYRKFQMEGGSAESILGSLLFDDGAVNISELLDKKDQYEMRWRKQYMMNEQAYRIRRFQRIKEILVMEYTNQTKNSSEKDFPLHERHLCHELFVNGVNALTIDEMDDLVMVCLKLLGKSRFRNRNVYDILSGLAFIRKKNPDIDPKEAASISIIEYVSRWVASQMVVSKHGRAV